MRWRWRWELGRKGSSGTVVGGATESGEGSDVTSPAPAYHSLEMGFSLPQPMGVLGSRSGFG